MQIPSVILKMATNLTQQKPMDYADTCRLTGPQNELPRHLRQIIKIIKFKIPSFFQSLLKTSAIN